MRRASAACTDADPTSPVSCPGSNSTASAAPLGPSHFASLGQHWLVESSHVFHFHGTVTASNLSRVWMMEAFVGSRKCHPPWPRLCSMGRKTPEASGTVHTRIDKTHTYKDVMSMMYVLCAPKYLTGIGKTLVFNGIHYEISWTAYTVVISPQHSRSAVAHTFLHASFKSYNMFSHSPSFSWLSHSRFPSLARLELCCLATLYHIPSMLLSLSYRICGSQNSAIINKCDIGLAHQDHDHNTRSPIIPSRLAQ